MAQLASHDKQIPNGFFFVQPEINWDSRNVIGRYPSWNTLVEAVLNMRRSNPAITTQYGWSTDRASIEAEIDRFLTRVCISMGWTSYVIGLSNNEQLPDITEAKKALGLSQLSAQLAAVAGRVKTIWQGAKVLTDWLNSGTEPVTVDIANARALKCVTCKYNGKGDFSRWFTQPASDLIKKQIEQGQGYGLHTDYDNDLNICELCLCPLKLKVHTPAEYIKASLTDQLIKELKTKADWCWILDIYR